MFKASLTIHKDPKGKLEVLAVSENADVALKAFLSCDKPGEVQYQRAGRIEKQKKIDAPVKKATKKAAKKAE